ncbi:hypothetical protein HRI_001701300 [Hibiscus trionum]|uniref:Uncharacterized protein n=1 Tax=Hibiscus trionum TaxID=183268 RepID=A0A9W7HQV9_HIBTR|nr:hypothetical protein HRI_001701300 [Hibiscus trionum]
MAGEEVDYSLRETRPNIGRVSGNESLTSSFDLVEQMEFLFVRIVRARDLPMETPNGTMNPYVVTRNKNRKLLCHDEVLREGTGFGMEPSFRLQTRSVPGYNNGYQCDQRGYDW